MNKKDIKKGSFDGIANKFDENIYGTTKGQIRHHLLLNILQPYIESSPMNILDLGGGTGMMSLEFAKYGHNITIADISEDALVIAKTRLASYPNTRFYCLDILDDNQLSSCFSVQEQYDFIICHALLEWLDKPEDLLNVLSKFTHANTRVSLSFFNQHAKIFNNLLFANFDYVEKGMPAKNTVRLNPHNAQKPEEIIQLIEHSGDFDITQTQGIRCIHDYIIDKSRIQPQFDKLLEMETIYGKQEPYKWLGKYFHIMLKAL